MNRRLIVLNIVLLALAGWLSWMLRLKWIELHKHEHTVLALPPHVRNSMVPPSPPMFKPMAAADYNEVAQKMLFSKDRNPNVIVDPPKPPPPPPPPPPMPELPAYYGLMDIGNPVVVLRLPKGVQKNYHAGEAVGPFKLVSFNHDKIVFDWDGKTVERKPDDLREKDAPPQQVASAPQPPPPQVAPAGNSSNGARSIGGSSDTEKVSEKLGQDNGGGVRMCVKGDTSPPGTIIDGYKKRIATNMFGETCMWEKINP